MTALENFVVCRWSSAKQHPDADRLTVCMVALGEGDTAQIVCGAPNVAEGQTVAVARPGAVMPGGVKLKKAKLRGVESEGMILAEDEVAIGTLHDGIMVLDDDLRAGDPARGRAPITPDVLEPEITPNRPDRLSIYGLAREVHAATAARAEPPPGRTSAADSTGEIPGFSIQVRDSELSPRFTARLYEDVKLGESPPWLKARLMAAGQRPISNVVDITNFVMLGSGQPMHAFDADLVAGGRLVVRRAKDGETMTRLDEVERRLDDEDAGDRRRRGPDLDRGVMGGVRSEVNDTTTRVLMEADVERAEHPAHLDAPRAAHPGLRALREAALTRAGDGGPGTRGEADDRAVRRTAGRRHDRRRRAGPAPQVVRLRGAREAAPGAPIARDEQNVILQRLGFGVAPADDGLDVSVPHWRRNDVTRRPTSSRRSAASRATSSCRQVPSRRGVSSGLEPAQDCAAAPRTRSSAPARPRS